MDWDVVITAALGFAASIVTGVCTLKSVKKSELMHRRADAYEIYIDHLHRYLDGRDGLNDLMEAEWRVRIVASRSVSSKLHSVHSAVVGYCSTDEVSVQNLESATIAITQAMQKDLRKD